MHELLIEIVNPDTNQVVKPNVKMSFDGKLSIREANDILFAQGGNVFRVLKVLKENPFLPPVREV